MDDLTDEVFTKGGNKKDNVFMIRYYQLSKRLFPSAFQIFRLSLNSQPAVNFPPLTARLLYEKFTDHIEQDEPLNIYDPVVVGVVGYLVLCHLRKYTLYWYRS